MVKRTQLCATQANSYSNVVPISSTCKYSLKVNNHRKKKKKTILRKEKRINMTKVGYIKTPHNTTKYLINNYYKNRQIPSEEENEDDDNIEALFLNENMKIPQGSMLMNQRDNEGMLNNQLKHNLDYDISFDDSEDSIRTQVQTPIQSPKKTSNIIKEDCSISLIN